MTAPELPQPADAPAGSLRRDARHIVALAWPTMIGQLAVLGFAGMKLLAASWVKLPPLASIGVIAVCLGVSIIASVVANRRDRRILQPSLQDAQTHIATSQQ